MASASVLYELANPAEEQLSGDVWKWKLYALRRSRKELTEVIPMPSTQYLDLSPIHSSADKWEKVYREMENSAQLVDSIWLLVQNRVQRHLFLRMKLREGFLEQLIRHCIDHAREIAEKGSQINVETKRIEMRDIQIKMQHNVFDENREGDRKKHEGSADDSHLIDALLSNKVLFSPLFSRSDK